MALFTKESEANRTSDTGKGSRLGLTGASIKASELKISLVVMEDSFTMMEMFTKANGEMGKLMAGGLTSTTTEPSMKDTGLTISNTKKAQKLGPIELNISALTAKDRRTERESLNVQMGADLKGNFEITTSMDLELINGAMDESTLEIGKTTKWMGQVALHGMTGGLIQVNTCRTKSRDGKCFSGQMGGNTKDSDQTASSTGEAFKYRRMEAEKRAPGGKEKKIK